MRRDDLSRRYIKEYAEHCRAARSAPILPSACSVGAAIPPETLWNIFRSVLPVSDTDKKGLAALSLTCRDWARVVRPILFHRLILCIPEDVDELLKSLASPLLLEPTRSTCIRSVRYSMKAEQVPPWIRLHKLSKIIPKARMELSVDSIPGESLLKVFPRTLPFSIFQFHSIYIGRIQFKRANEFVPLFNQKVDDCEFVDLNIQHAITRMPMPRPQPPLQQQQFWTLQKGYTDCQGPLFSDIVFGTDNVFAIHFNLVCALCRPADRLGLDRATWNSIADIVTALVPPDFGITNINVGGGKQSGDKRCA